MCPYVLEVCIIYNSCINLLFAVYIYLYHAQVQLVQEFASRYYAGSLVVCPFFIVRTDLLLHDLVWNERCFPYLHRRMICKIRLEEVTWTKT